MKKDILVIGGGGREHAIIWALKRSKDCGKLYCAPGNAGIEEIAECLSIGVMNFQDIADFAISKCIYMVVVAPDDPLAAGLVNYLEDRGIRAFGPRSEAAIIEASKSFSKDLMKKYSIPTADYQVFDDYNSALKYIQSIDYPIVIKADGLALGKGVLICNKLSEGEQALKDMMLYNAFGKSGNRVVVEEFMTGPEVSVLAFTDGNTILPMVSAQDHKRAYDNDEGLNTGGMGTFAPSKAHNKDIEKLVYDTIILPSMHAMNSENRKFKGVLYFGLMLTPKGPKVVEYNARFGDPETQVVLPLMQGDLLEVFDAIIDEHLDKVNISWANKSAVCVILASGGYPLKYNKGEIITINNIDKDVMLFHAGTARDESGNLITNGGRVLGVTAVGDSIEDARAVAYANVNKVKFNNAHYRKDIGIKL